MPICGHCYRTFHKKPLGFLISQTCAHRLIFSSQVLITEHLFIGKLVFLIFACVNIVGSLMLPDISSKRLEVSNDACLYSLVVSSRTHRDRFFFFLLLDTEENPSTNHSSQYCLRFIREMDDNFGHFTLGLFSAILKCRKY